jgi:hypothetical protein
MRRFFKRTLFGLVPAALAALVLGGPTASPTLGLQNVNLSCNDSTNLNLALDTTSLASLTDAVSAVNLYPAGDPALACGLTQSTSTRSSSSGDPNGPQDFVVGGGQAREGLSGCAGDANFSVSAHSSDTGGNAAPTSGGTFNLTQTPSSCAGFSGHLVSKIDCLRVPGQGGPPGSAQITALVTKATGVYAAKLGTETEVDLFDSGAPGGVGDTIGVYDFSVSCDTGPWFAYASVDQGNINVHGN